MIKKNSPKYRGENYPFGRSPDDGLDASFGDLFDEDRFDSALVRHENQRPRTPKSRRGKQQYPPPQKQLDLHGLTGVEAEAKVINFLENSRRNGLLTVRVITGKGLHSPDNKPVLPGLIEQLLKVLKKDGKIVSFQWSGKAKNKSGSLLVFL